MKTPNTISTDHPCLKFLSLTNFTKDSQKLKQIKEFQSLRIPNLLSKSNNQKPKFYKSERTQGTIDFENDKFLRTLLLLLRNRLLK